MSTRQDADPINDVAEIVRSTRQERHFTQAQLADLAHVSRGFVVDLERGHSRAELGKVFKVFQALDLSLVPLSPSRSTATLLALIEKGQQLAGHQPSPEALDRAGRVLAGETSVDDARAELEVKYGHLRSR